MTRFTSNSRIPRTSAARAASAALDCVPVVDAVVVDVVTAAAAAVFIVVVDPAAAAAAAASAR